MVHAVDAWALPGGALPCPAWCAFQPL